MNFETGDGGIGACAKSGICRVYPWKQGDTEATEQVLCKGGFGDYRKGELRGSVTEIK